MYHKHHVPLLESIIDMLEEKTKPDVIIESLEEILRYDVFSLETITFSELEELFGVGQDAMSRRLKQNNISHIGRNKERNYIFSPKSIYPLYREYYMHFQMSIVYRLAKRLGYEENQIKRIFAGNKHIKKNLFDYPSIPVKELLHFVQTKLEEKDIRENWYTTKDLAKEKGCALFTAGEWIRNKEVKTKMLKYQHYISPEEFDRITSMKNVTEMMEILGISENGFRREYENNRISYERFNGKIVFSGQEVKRILELYEKGELFRISKNKQLRKKLNKELKNLDLKNIDFNTSLENLRKNKTILDLMIIGAKKGINIAQEKLLDLMKDKARIRARCDARKFRIPYEDSLHYANLGILKAIEWYPHFEVDFTGFACSYMKYTSFKLIMQEYRKQGIKFIDGLHSFQQYLYK